MSWKIYHKVACPNCQMTLEVAPQVSRISFELTGEKIAAVSGAVLKEQEQVLVVAWKTSFIYHECGQPQNVNDQWQATPDDLRLEQ